MKRKENFTPQIRIAVARCTLSILEHQWDVIFDFPNKQAWKSMKFLFESMIVDATDTKDYIKRVKA